MLLMEDIIFIYRLTMKNNFRCQVLLDTELDGLHSSLCIFMRYAKIHVFIIDQCSHGRHQKLLPKSICNMFEKDCFHCYGAQKLVPITSIHPPKCRWHWKNVKQKYP